MSQIYKLPLVLEPQLDGGYVVTCPLLPELITEGDTVQDALHNANDALAAIVDGFKQLKRPLPSVLQPHKLTLLYKELRNVETSEFLLLCGSTWPRNNFGMLQARTDRD